LALGCARSPMRGRCGWAEPHSSTVETEAGSCPRSMLERGQAPSSSRAARDNPDKRGHRLLPLSPGGVCWGWVVRVRTEDMQPSRVGLRSCRVSEPCHPLAQVGRDAGQGWCGWMVSGQDVLQSCFFPTSCCLAPALHLKVSFGKSKREVR